MYKLIEAKEISDKLKDGKYFTYAKVKEVRDDGFLIEDANVFFLSIFKVNKEDFIRLFFTKDKEDFIVDMIQKIDFENFKKVNEIYMKYKNLYI